MKNVASQVDEMFNFASIVHGHHVYNRVWTPFLGRFCLLLWQRPFPVLRIFTLAAVVAVPLLIKCSIYSREATVLDMDNLPFSADMPHRFSAGSHSAIHRSPARQCVDSPQICTIVRG